MSKKLLLADDSITIQKVIQITFSQEDCQLTIADNGDTAYERARELVPDLVLADVYMPGRNGYELCAAIKQTPELQHVPVLLLAGSFEPFDEARARAAGADDWIEKPFESQALIDKVTELLSAAPLAAASAPAAPAVDEPPVVEPAAAEPVIAEPAVAEPASALETMDPFADIVFEEPAASAPSLVDAADDWNHLGGSAEMPSIGAAADEFVFEELPGSAPEFEFSEEPFPSPGEPPSATDMLPAAADQDFEGGDEILALGDDDIISGDDLEPVADTSTLTPWSRQALPAEEPFPGSATAELPAFASVDQPLPPAEPETQPSVAAATEPAADLWPEPAAGFELEPGVEPAPEPVAEPLPQPVPAAAATEAGVSALSTEELERVVERAVARAIEKLAGSVLERVAWEVVPDLAEALIKEEIRKIKDEAG